MNKSVEEQIREELSKLGNISSSGEIVLTWTNKNILEEATQAILSIIETEVIGGKSWHTCFDSSKCNRDCRGMVKNDLRQAQRNKLRRK